MFRAFFKRKGLVNDFERYLNNGGKSFRRLLDKRLARFDELMAAMYSEPRKAKGAAAGT